jgi:glycosyltransferase involved in cell wall biosynthesis
MIRFATISPCYNEELVLEQSVARLSALFDDLTAKKKISPESLIVFVNDGSTDGTWPLIERLHRENSRVRGINLTRNVGHQNAIMAGMMTAREWADAVVTIDADLQDDIHCIEKMVDSYEEGYDVVYGVKVEREADPLMKRLTALAFYKLQKKMDVESVFNHADFRLMSRRALDMLAGYHERNLYLRGLVPMVGLKSTTVDDVISEREAGESKYTLKKMLNLAMDGITSFSVKPIYIILYMGILFMVVTLMIAIYVIRALIVGTAVSGWASLILSIWFVGGFILIALGIVGLYIGKIYTEVKHRPLYHIKDII